jgi:hypothetical protein
VGFPFAIEGILENLLLRPPIGVIFGEVCVLGLDVTTGFMSAPGIYGFRWCGGRASTGKRKGPPIGVGSPLATVVPKHRKVIRATQEIGCSDDTCASEIASLGPIRSDEKKPRIAQGFKSGEAWLRGGSQTLDCVIHG